MNATAAAQHVRGAGHADRHDADVLHVGLGAVPGAATGGQFHLVRKFNPLEAAFHRYSQRISSLTMEEARLRGNLYPVGSTGLLRLREVGDVPVEVIGQTVDGNRVRLRPTPPQREALMVRFYAEGAAPGTSRAQLAGPGRGGRGSGACSRTDLGLPIGFCFTG